MWFTDRHQSTVPYLGSLLLWLCVSHTHSSSMWKTGYTVGLQELRRELPSQCWPYARRPIPWLWSPGDECHCCYPFLSLLQPPSLVQQQEKTGMSGSSSQPLLSGVSRGQGLSTSMAYFVFSRSAEFSGKGRIKKRRIRRKAVALAS